MRRARPPSERRRALPQLPPLGRRSRRPPRSILTLHCPPFRGPRMFARARHWSPGSRMSMLTCSKRRRSHRPPPRVRPRRPRRRGRPRRRRTPILPSARRPLAFRTPVCLVAQEPPLPAPPLLCAWGERRATNARRAFRQESRAHLLWLEILKVPVRSVASLVIQGYRYKATCPVDCAHMGSCPMSRAPSGAIPHPGTMIVWPKSRWGLVVAAKCLFPHLPCHDYASRGLPCVASVDVHRRFRYAPCRHDID